MKKERLSDEIGKIDEDIIEEADSRRQAYANGGKPARKKSPLLIAVSVFAAAAAGITGIAVIPRLTDGSAIPADTSVTEAAVTAPAAPGNVSVTEPDETAQKKAFTRDRRTSGIVSDVAAVTAAGECISPDSEFLITVPNGVTEDVLKSRLHLSPESTFTLTRSTDNSYILNAGRTFERGSLVKLTVDDEHGELCDSWAFRTADRFAVDSVYPYDGADFVSIDSGIEFEFTAKPSGNAAEFFEISPAVNGKFEIHEKTLYFIPGENMRPNTAYSVTLKAGFVSADGEALEEDKTVGFRTSAFSADGTYLFTGSSNSGFSETFLPGDRPCVEIYCSRDLRNEEFDTHLYSYNSADDYSAAIRSRAQSKWADSAVTDVSGLTEVFAEKSVPYAPEDSDSVFVLLPDELEKGWYIADISVGGEGSPYTVQYFVQVSPVSVYALSLGEENLFFINDTVSGEPASGVSAALTTDAGSYTGTSDSDGLVYVKTGGEGGYAMLDITSGGERYCDIFTLSDAQNVNDLYYSYIYTDREAYLTTDTINVWGVLIPKAHTTPVPEDLYLQLDSEVRPVTPGAGGTFTASFTFKDHAGDWGAAVLLKSGDDRICAHYIIINDYEKPTYTLDLDVPEYIVMPQYNETPVTLTASYYEGTPAEGLTLGTDSFGVISEPNELVTDAEGKATAAIKAARTDPTWQMGAMYVNYNITGIENTYTSVSKRIPVFTRDRMLESEFDAKAQTLALHTYDLDLGKADEFMKTVDKDYIFGYQNGDYNVLKSGTCDIPVTVKITRHWTTKTETGSRYDFIEKRNIKTYRYERNSHIVYFETVNTVNGEVLLTDLPTADEGSYHIDLTYSDSRGQNVQDMIYSDESYYSDIISFTDSNGYTLFTSRESGAEIYTLEASSDLPGSNEEYGYYASFDENTDVTFRLKCSTGNENFSGRVLLVLSKNDLVTYRVFDLNGGNSFTYRPGADCIPDVRCSAAYFDGRRVYSVNGSYLDYDPSGRGIELDIISDRETYDAGDTAELAVTARDMSGNIVPGAQVLFSIVDEAAFAIAGQTADALNGLYEYVSYPFARSYTSYIQHFPAGSSAGEKGGGGPASVRREFRDTAFFADAVTGADGIARVSVKLPDNLTSWRVTVLAVCEQAEGYVLAGSGRSELITTRPLFITPIIHSQFVEGDDVAVSAKCAGLGEGGSITVSISGGDADKTLVIKEQETANFGKLPAGEYTVLFSAEKDGFTDAVEKPVTVTETLLETWISRSGDITGLAQSIRPTKWPVSVAFFNKEYLFNAKLLFELCRYSGNSLDSQLASDCAAHELGFITDEELAERFVQAVSGGLARTLPTAEPSVYLTSLICAAAPDSVSPAAVTELRSTVDSYFRYNVGSIDKVCEAYLGLAALGEPVLGEVREIAEKADITYVPDGICLSAALALCGDYKGAYDLYIKYVPEVTIDDSDPDAPFAYILGTNGEPNQAYTKKALLTASVLGLPEAQYFARYLISDDPQYSSYALELAFYLKNYIPVYEDGASFSYRLGNETKTVELEKYFPVTISFTEDQFRSADFTVLSGEIFTISNYIGRVSENPAAPSQKVTKTLDGELAAGEAITVNIVTAPYSVIYDVVPSCGRLTGSQSGQLVRLCADRYGKASYRFTISTEGEYVLESTVAYNYTDDVWGMSERSVIKVGGNDVQT